MHQSEPDPGAEAEDAGWWQGEIGVEPEGVGLERGAQVIDEGTDLFARKTIEEEEGGDGVVGVGGEVEGEGVGLAQRDAGAVLGSKAAGGAGEHAGAEIDRVDAGVRRDAAGEGESAAVAVAEEQDAFAVAEL